MDVRCERCSTEYEFDDALISGRGTTVKCTNCGHRFKVRRPGADVSEDFWNVQTADGRQLIFGSLRELQRGIHAQVVDRGDFLSRPGFGERSIGSIPELAPFFQPVDRASPVAEGAMPSASSARPSQPPPALDGAAPEFASFPPVRQRMSTQTDFPPLRPEGQSPLESVLSTERTLSNRPIEERAETATAEPGPAAPHADPGVQTVHEGASVDLPPTTSGVTKLAPTDSPEPRSPPEAEDAERMPWPSATESEALYGSANVVGGSRPSLYDSLLPPRKSRTGLVALAVVVGAGLAGAVWSRESLRSMIASRRASPSAPSYALDGRVAGLVEVGEKALADGNFESAKESFDKASALAEHDPRVLLDAARLASIRADIVWLKLKLLPPDAVTEHRLAAAELADRLAAARKAADDALAVAEGDPTALRTKLETLRMAGNTVGARALALKLVPFASQPETAYALATLEFIESAPVWPKVIEPLRLAAKSESGPGRARAMLVYALLGSGDRERAQRELSALAQMPRPHPLLPWLVSFANRTKGTDSKDAGVSAQVADGGRVFAERADRQEFRPTDARQLVALGDAARARGDLDRALKWFSAALERSPGDAEALNGVASVAHARRDLTGARAAYKRVLSVNASYVPALVGLGDVDWDSGDRGSAMKTYKEIVDRFPESSYPIRIKRRVEAAGSAPEAVAPPSFSSPRSTNSPAPSDP